MLPRVPRGGDRPQPGVREEHTEASGLVRGGPGAAGKGLYCGTGEAVGEVGSRLVALHLKSVQASVLFLALGIC